ncbi:tetratricopeptide repeat protein [Telmatospirillum siberiense]|nr:tetratricopeptide repeat protein [Telmatospirillum siberiense]
MRQSITLALLGAAFLGAAGTPVRAAAPAREPPSCLVEIAKAEQRHRLPPGLLVSIALVESGRHDAMTGLTTPWPWTINSQGAGHFYDSADDALQETGRLLADGIGVIDVGCMQVDLYHHPHAFRTLAAAFDPETNVDYAARHLLALHHRLGSWPAAAAAYHAGDPAQGLDYAARVLYYWRTLHTTADSAQPVPGNPRRRGFVVTAAPGPLDVASAFFVKKDYAAALAIYRASLQIRPDDQTALLGIAECLGQTGHDEDARFYYERALIAEPRNAVALDGLLRLIDAGPAEKRFPRLLSARQVAPDAAPVHARLAMIEAEHGRLADAVADMASAVRLSPDNATLALNYALLLDRAGNPAAAQAYDAFLRLYRPGNATLSVSLHSIRERQAYLQEHTR